MNRHTITITITVNAPTTVSPAALSEALHRYIEEPRNVQLTVEAIAATLPGKPGRKSIVTSDQRDLISAMLDAQQSLRHIALITGLTRPVVSRTAAKLKAVSRVPTSSALLDSASFDGEAKETRAAGNATPPQSRPRKCSYGVETTGTPCGKPSETVAVFESDLTEDGLFYTGRCAQCLAIDGADNTGILTIEAEAGQVNDLTQ